MAGVGLFPDIAVDEPVGFDQADQVGGTPRERPEGSGASPAPCLKVDICTHARVEYWEGGGLGRVYRPRLDGGGGRKNVVKAKIRGFSRGSRRLLLQAVGTVNAVHYGPRQIWFLTLTYHQGWPGPREAKERHLRAFFERIRRRYGSWGGLWRLEAQVRGAPHFHVVLFTDRELGSEEHLWLVDSWVDVIGGGEKCWRFHMGMAKNDRGEWSESCCSMVHDVNRLREYVGKYMGKVEGADGWEEPGRYWGWFCKSSVKREKVEVVLTEDEVNRVERCMRRWLKHQRTGVWRIQWPDGTVERRRPENANERRLWLGMGSWGSGMLQVRPYHRRKRGRAGAGIVVPWASSVFERVISWVRADAVGRPEPMKGVVPRIMNPNVLATRWCQEKKPVPGAVYLPGVPVGL